MYVIASLREAISYFNYEIASSLLLLAMTAYFGFIILLRINQEPGYDR
jgi:NADH:ubiquinone oxidoreductase subunit H